MVRVLTPPRVRGTEYLDDPDVAPSVMQRSLKDVARSNALFGGTRAVLSELRPVFAAAAGRRMTLLDVGSGVGDIPKAARELAHRRGVQLVTVSLDGSPALAAPSRARGNLALCGDALHLPFADGSIDVVMCSQVLHHFRDDDACRLIAEMHRVAAARVVIADIRRSWIAAAGIWLMSFPLRFHPVSRHDGVVSVMRGFVAAELRALIRRAVGVDSRVKRRAGFRVTASWVRA